VLSKEDWWCFP